MKNILGSLITLRLLCVVYFFIVLALSLSPGSGQPSIPHLDKVGHFLAYTGFTFLLRFAFPRSSPKIIFLLAVLLGITLEYLQSFVPGRDMSFKDGIANSLGALTGILLYPYWSKTTSKQFKSF